MFSWQHVDSRNRQRRFDQTLQDGAPERDLAHCCATPRPRNLASHHFFGAVRMLLQQSVRAGDYRIFGLRKHVNSPYAKPLRESENIKIRRRRKVSLPKK